MKNLGAHMSIAGGLHLACERGRDPLNLGLLRKLAGAPGLRPQAAGKGR